MLKVLNRKRPEGKELNIEQAYKRLTSHTVDGLVIKPLYTIDDGFIETDDGEVRKMLAESFEMMQKANTTVEVMEMDPKEK